jgi:hypothetical protein
MGVEKMNLIEELFGLAIASAPTKGLKIHQEDGTAFNTRLSLNVLIVSPFGTGKSSFLGTIERAGYGVVVHEYTLPALIGTIKKSGEIIEGFVIRSAGKTLLIDEFQKFGKREKEALLSIMEDHVYTRTLGYQIAPPVSKGDEFWSIEGEGNAFTVRVRNAFIIGSMYFRKRTIEDKALLSRSFPLVVRPTIEDAISIITRGSNFRLPKELDDWYNATLNKEAEMPVEVGKYLSKRYQEEVKEDMIEIGFIVRGMMDIARLSGLYALIDGRTEITKDDIDKALKFAPLQVMGYNLGSLTPASIEVYSIVANHPEGIRQKEVIRLSKYSVRQVKESLAELLGAKLVKQVKLGGKVYYFPKGVELR